MTTFKELGIQEDILKGIKALGFTSPTPVQEQIIPLVLHNHTDILGLAQTGTGKTAAFGIPLAQLANTNKNQTQALILCPTRELCVQVSRDIAAIAQHVPDLKTVAVYGGAGIEQQIKSLRRGAHILVATPGRLNDLIRRRKVNISQLQSVVLDEADEMLQMGFQDELNAILAQTPESKNTLLFSATMPKDVAAIAGRYMNDPQEITIGRRNAGSENIRHIYYMVQAKNRYLAVRRIVDMEPDMYSIIFCRTRQETKEVADKLLQDGYSADALHGDLSQSQRDYVMNKFRRKRLQILVATDVAARGLDVNDLTHVINYNLPDDVAFYTHRSGRTGRAGKTGTSIAIIHMRERHRVRTIENKLKRKFEQGVIPSGREVCEKKMLTLTDAVKNIDVHHEQIDPVLPAISKTLESLSREELIKHFVSLEFNQLLDDYRHAPDLNVTEERKDRKHKKTGKPAPRPSQQKFTQLLFNVGKNDGVHPRRLIGRINETTTGRVGIKIGKIEVMNNSAMLEADSNFIDQVLNAFRHVAINGKTVSIDVGGERVEKRRKQSGPRMRRPPWPTAKTGYHKKGRKRKKFPAP